jgi:hypothetical protein
LFSGREPSAVPALLSFGRLSSIAWSSLLNATRTKGYLAHEAGRQARRRQWDAGRSWGQLMGNRAPSMSAAAPL